MWAGRWDVKDNGWPPSCRCFCFSSQRKRAGEHFFSPCDCSGTQFKNHHPTNTRDKTKIKNKDPLPVQESSSFFSLMATPCAAAAVILRATQLRSPISFYSYNSQWNANISGTLKVVSLLHFMRGLGALVPCESICSDLCQFVSASMLPSQNCCSYCTWRLRWFLF